MSPCEVAFINATSETFSPTSAGAAISMWVWEMCLAARRSGVEPLVITKSSDALAYDWKRTVFVPFPKAPANAILDFAARAERKLTGWRYLRQRNYVHRVAEAIRSAGLEKGCLVLHNDPEMTIHLRRLLPKAQLFLLFHNSNHYMSRKFRGDLLRSATAVLAVSNAAARAVELAYQLPQGSVKTLYNGVDVEKFRPAELSVEGMPVINFTGRIRYEKAPDLLLKAALLVSKTTKNFSIQLLGRSELLEGEVDAYEAEIRELIKAVESRGIVVRQAGYVDRLHVADEVRKAHIHVTPSRKQEEFGMATIEAMATGLATIASDTGGTPEVVGSAGMLFPSESFQNLANHLLALLLDEKLRADFGKAALERALSFTWDRTLANLLELAAPR